MRWRRSTWYFAALRGRPQAAATANTMTTIRSAPQKSFGIISAPSAMTVQASAPFRPRRLGEARDVRPPAACPCPRRGGRGAAEGLIALNDLEWICIARRALRIRLIQGQAQPPVHSQHLLPPLRQ